MANKKKFQQQNKWERKELPTVRDSHRKYTQVQCLESFYRSILWRLVRYSGFVSEIYIKMLLSVSNWVNVWCHSLLLLLMNAFWEFAQEAWTLWCIFDVVLCRCCFMQVLLMNEYCWRKLSSSLYLFFVFFILNVW